MPNQITFAATITPATAPMEVSINSGTTFTAATFATVGSNQQYVMTGVAAATYVINQLQLRAVGYGSTTTQMNGAAVVVSAAAPTVTGATFTAA